MIITNILLLAILVILFVSQASHSDDLKAIKDSLERIEELLEEDKTEESQQ